jgi:predicted RNase H-like HicB family nuclease
MVKYLVIYEKTGTGYSAYIPDLPGCVATGKTKKMVEESIYEAIKFHLEGLREEGIPLPKQLTESEMLAIA